MADMDNIISLFGGEDPDDELNTPKNENFYIGKILNLMQDSNNFPLYIYCMIKTLLQKKDVLNDTQLNEIAQILNIKPKIIEKKVTVEKKIYIDRKPKVFAGDDY